MSNTPAAAFRLHFLYLRCWFMAASILPRLNVWEHDG